MPSAPDSCCWGRGRGLTSLRPWHLSCSRFKSVVAILAFSAAASDRVGVLFLKALMVGALGGAAGGLIYGLWASSPPSPVLFWMRLWTGVGVGIGLTAALVIGLTVRARAWFENHPKRTLQRGIGIGGGPVHWGSRSASHWACLLCC